LARRSLVRSRAFTPISGLAVERAWRVRKLFDLGEAGRNAPCRRVARASRIETSIELKAPMASLTVAIQMDPIDKIDIAADSTFALALEAQARGHKLLYYGPRDLNFRDGKISARVQSLSVQNSKGDHFRLGAPELYDLTKADIILMRQDPPFDMAYITATHILERLHPKTLVVNDPFHVRNAPEKLFVTQFEGVMPPTLITSDRDAIRAFRAEHKEIIVKPLYGNGGAGVFRLKPDDENLNSLLEMFTQFYREPVIVQRYLPEVRKGDKRIILVDGQPSGAVNRVPAEAEAR